MAREKKVWVTKMELPIIQVFVRQGLYFADVVLIKEMED